VNLGDNKSLKTNMKQARAQMQKRKAVVTFLQQLVETNN
jgi:hypothetical protein